MWLGVWLGLHGVDAHNYWMTRGGAGWSLDGGGAGIRLDGGGAW